MRYIWGLCLAVFFLGFSATWAGVSLPLPVGGIKITPPPQTIPLEVRKFSGAFRGKLESIRYHPGMRRTWQEVLLVVERITSNNQAQIYVAWGDEQGPRAMAKAGSKKLTAKFEDYAGLIYLEGKDKDQKIYWTFRFEKSGALFCVMDVMDDISKNLSRQGELKRIPNK